ncbi:MAG: twitching motility protein PilT [SAR86 cluster bacterium]|uniref:Twitching motility protein PilT n=1 Tax=SAR86 cluster bacterium TaxID=2030880 RepID=A0A2A4XHV6_9GAMM|nr:MAG: twitching motility protein PilT [SAR86 cluster bacterium]
MGELTAGVNWMAVGISAILSFGLGALWFSPMMFGEKWAAGVGIEIGGESTQPKAALILQFLGTCLLAWLIGIAAASDALMLASLITLTISVLMIASGLFGGNSRYAAIAEGVFPIAMFLIMMLCHAVL